MTVGAVNLEEGGSPHVTSVNNIRRNESSGSRLVDLAVGIRTDQLVQLNRAVIADAKRKISQINGPSEDLLHIIADILDQAQEDFDSKANS